MRILPTLALLATASPVLANPQADSFASIYASTCLKHLTNLDVLRAKLKDVPELPPEKAKPFLQGAAGNAWPVPDPHGLFVVALTKGLNTCSVFARRVDAQTAEELFLKIVQEAPPPFVSRLAGDRRSQDARNGNTRTVSYEWSVPQAQRKMLFMLTTATADSAEVQGLATASMVR